jgi:hypothetical protein
MKNELLRHTLSTIAYRFQKSIKDTNGDFENYRASANSRSVIEIINHIFDVINKTKVFIHEERFEKTSPEKLDLRSEIERLHNSLEELDFILSEKDIDINYGKKLFQGPLSDVLSHIGQISFLRGLSGNKLKGEDFSAAKIITGNTSANQNLK